MFYLPIFRVRLPPRLYSGNKKAGKPRSAPFTFGFTSFPPCLPTKFEFGFRSPSRVAVIISARSRAAAKFIAEFANSDKHHLRHLANTNTNSKADSDPAALDAGQK